MDQTIVIAILILVIAVLYASVGHAGASGYLAAMALVGLEPQVMKPMALTLNVLVGTIGSIRYFRAGCFRWPLFWPFAVASIPMAFVGGAIQLPATLYRPLVGVLLWFAAARMVQSARHKREPPIRPLRATHGVICGLAIGMLAGLTGTGGGIFLSPLLLTMRWASTREMAGVTAVFVLVNSIAGLLGNLTSVTYLPIQSVVICTAAAGIGGWIGAGLGSRRLTPSALRLLLAVVLVIAGGKMVLF